jgi:hypothetical protein
VDNKSGRRGERHAGGRPEQARPPGCAGVDEWADLPGLRERLAEVTRRAKEGGAVDGAAAGG